MKTSREWAENTAFDAVIWSAALVGTGNHKYQDKFYETQAEKILNSYAAEYQ